MRKSIAVFWFGTCLLASLPVLAQDHIQGSMTVEGKSIALTQEYAYTNPGFFDPKTRDTVVLFCDAPVPPAAVRDPFARAELVKAGKLHCVGQTIDSKKAVINFQTQHSRIGTPDNGASTEHIFDAKTLDAKAIAGHSYTKGAQKSFNGTPYSYDVTFSAAISPEK